MGGSLTSKFHKCVANKESASYPFGSRHETLALIRRYAEWAEAHGRDFAICVLKYMDGKTAVGPRDALTFTFRLGGSKDGFSVAQCQVIFPPHFPKVPPILAVKATGLAGFDRTRHARHPLPTRYFEVKLETYHFKTQPERLMDAFRMVLAQDFPQVSTKDLPVVVYQFPDRFDERYNNVATVFPFDISLKLLRGLSSEHDPASVRQRSEYAHDVDMLRDHLHRLQYDPMPTSRAASDNARTAVQLREEIAMMRATTQRLTKRIGEYEGVAVEDIVTKQQRSEEVECFELESKLIGFRETIGFLEDQLADNHSADFQAVSGILAKLYEQEFEVARRAKALPIVRRFAERAV